jgi:hypothetical protein
MVQFISCPPHIRMTSVRIDRHGPQFCDDVLDNCQHADFFFSSGYVASCYHNEDHMISECYYTAVDPEMFEHGSETELWETLSETKLNVKDWKKKQYIDEEIVNHILNWMSPDELVEVEEE